MVCKASQMAKDSTPRRRGGSITVTASIVYPRINVTAASHTRLTSKDDSKHLTWPRVRPRSEILHVRMKKLRIGQNTTVPKKSSSGRYGGRKWCFCLFSNLG